jgi:hypothetical protein
MDKSIIFTSSLTRIHIHPQGCDPDFVPQFSNKLAKRMLKTEGKFSEFSIVKRFQLNLRTGDCITPVTASVHPYFSRSCGVHDHFVVFHINIFRL